MVGLFWKIAEYAAIKLIDKALENEKKPYDTKPSDTLLERVRNRVQYHRSSSGHERSDSGLSDRPEQPGQDS